MTGFLLAGTGEVDVKKNANFLVVSPSEPPRPAAPHMAPTAAAAHGIRAAAATPRGREPKEGP